MLTNLASADDRERQRELQNRLRPYTFADHHLHRHLLARLTPGDRVVSRYRGRLGTVLQTDVPAWLPRKPDPMIIRFDEPGVSDDPEWLTGVSTVSALGLYPTPGLL
ncbi:hypothetical protein SMD44_p10015 (plasmid) [Streptomyces alboflavus]|uniref:Uncharacterized protein n=1 Tax=Streptomyces alboflavus TaxID=67267 RepID=A0A291W3D7_9ACTN|nr:hypothetical protein [Streptomyces alboflavus]ATM24514.1 hypothetical protein SMD44_p10015 [Streptomyces alboflavus]